MPISTEEENKQRKERSNKIRDTISKAVKGEKGLPAVRATEKPNKPIELEDKPKPRGPEGGHWGYHLLLDVSECNKKIDDEKAVILFLKDMVKLLKMTPIGEPIVVRVDTKEKGESARGMSAIQIITTSHISIHGDDDEWSAYIDIFSCAPYDPKVAIECVKKHFEPKHVGDIWIERDSGSWPKK